MKRYLIAGASSGIGYALAKQLISNGQEVISISRTAPDLQVAQHIPYNVKDEALPPAIDGALDGLVYCPGSINLKPFKGLKQSDFQNDIDISLHGAVKMIQRYLPNLQQSNSASIVLFSTVAVQTGMPYHASVAAAKGAVEGLGRACTQHTGECDSPLISKNAACSKAYR
jgi:3-oxoacyl-[acyl-carrier protein] reductase